ncbi:MAG: 50S ribosomal protein L29 [Tissierellia bacterium]|nr:50S ribosomal protein L29 [Tissierellia bacterium]
MKVKEIRQLSTEDLSKKENDLKHELFNLRFQMATGQLDNPSNLKKVRKDIARVKTIIRERELSAGREA